MGGLKNLADDWGVAVPVGKDSEALVGHCRRTEESEGRRYNSEREVPHCLDYGYV